MDLPSSPEDDFRESPVSSIYDDELTKRERAYLYDILKDSSDEQLKHMNRSWNYRFAARVLTTTIEIMGYITGSTGIGALVTLDMSQRNYEILLAISIMSFVQGIIGTIVRSTKLNSKAKKHRSATGEYGSIVQKVKEFLSGNGDTRVNIEKFKTEITLEKTIVDKEHK